MTEERKTAGNRRMRLVRLRPETISGESLAVMTRLLSQTLKMGQGRAEQFLKQYGRFKESAAS